MKFQFLYILFFIVISPVLKSQECNIAINKIYDSVAFVDFIEELEKDSDVRFFYKPEWLDTLIIANYKSQSTLGLILDENLRDTRLSYYIYDCNKIILSKDYKYIVGIPNSIFELNSDIKYDPEIEYNESSFIRNEIGHSNNGEKDVISIGNPSYKYLDKYATISGTVKDTVNNIPVVGAVIFIDNLGSATTSDENGDFKLIIEKGTHDLHIKSIGKKEKTQKIVLYSSGSINFCLEEEAQSLEEVYVYAGKEHNVRGLQLGFIKIDATSIKQIPSSVGETDILKLALLLPGVQTVGEGASGFNVRGGRTDQNLVIIDEAPIYNTSHLFGFFSTINAEMVEDFKLYKSSYPANYGGRLSSIFDVNLKNGEFEKFSVQGGISPITGKLLLEGPIIKNKLSFIIGGRSTYSDWLLKRIDAPMVKNSKASFYDLNIKLNYKLNKKNEIQIGNYKSYDYSRLNLDETYFYENLNGSFHWKHKFTDRLSVKLAGVYSKYNNSLATDADTVFASNFEYNLQHFEAKLDFMYLLNEKQKLQLGINGIEYKLNPGSLSPATEASNIAPLQLAKEKGVESAIYVNDEITLLDNLSLNLGFRYSFYQSLGPSEVYKYADGAAKSFESRTDTISYSNNEISGNYSFPEFRVSTRYQLSESSSIKASVTQMTQYIHMLTNTMSISPTDTWILTNPNLKPQRSYQYSLGYYQNFYRNMFETSIETYYKKSINQLEFKPGAQLLLNPNLEMDLIEGEGKAYGIELMIKKKAGSLNGWLSYTYSRSLIMVDSKYKSDEIKYDSYFPSNYDKPHDLTIVANYKISRRLSISTNITYNTGRPITYPVAWYNFRGRELLHYSDRNEYRIPDYFRIDLAINIEGNLKINKLAHSSWSFSIYNLTGRDNVYSIYFVSDPKTYVKGYKLSIFAKPIPSVTYNFRF